MQKILILRFSSIGDIVLTTPIVRSLKNALPNAQIHYAIKEDFAAVLKHNPYIDKLHIFKKNQSIYRFTEELAKEQFDFVVDLHKNLRTHFIKLRLGVKSASFDKLNYEKWLLVQFKKNILPNKHIVERYAEAVKPLGVQLDGGGLDYFLGEEDHFEKQWLPKPHQEGFVAFAIGGAHQTKKLPLKRMIELCDKINKPIVLLGGKEDQANGQAIYDFFEKDRDTFDSQEAIEKLNKRTRIFDGCGKLTLGQSASLLKQAQVVFTHDTGLMHIAAAFHRQIYSIWGNTTPHFGMYPYQTKFVIFENNKLSCRPCSKIGFKNCPKGHFKCMNELIFDFWIP